ncbi:MAG: hypothetical protein QW104_02565 [Nitrososphaerota archaeon]
MTYNIGDKLFQMEHRQKHIVAYYDLVEILSNAEVLSYKLSTEEYIPQNNFFINLTKKINMANEASGKTRAHIWKDIWGYMDEYKSLMVKELEKWHWTTAGEIQTLLSSAVIEEADDPSIIALWRRFVAWISGVLSGEQNKLQIRSAIGDYNGYKTAYRPYTIRHDQSMIEIIEDLAYKAYTKENCMAVGIWCGLYRQIISIMEDPYMIFHIGAVIGYIGNYLVKIEPFRIVLPSNHNWMEDLWNYMPHEVINLRKRLKGE